MSSTFRYILWTWRAALAVLVVAAAISIALAAACLRFPSALVDGNSGRPAAATWPVVSALANADWSLFQPAEGNIDSEHGQLSKLLRLAGTFIVYDANDTSVRKAVLDELATKEQHIVSEGDQVLTTVEVVSIFQNRIVLRSNGTDEELWLSFSQPTKDPDATTAPTGPPAGLKLLEGERVLASNQYGVKIDRNRWVMSMDKVMAYARDLEDHPSRLAALYDSMEPVYEQGKINGYRLNVQGEGDFFSDMGLKPGDIVRRVNTMHMSNRRRAEFWIDQFLGEKLNTVFLDVERGGQQMRLEYLVR